MLITDIPGITLCGAGRGRVLCAYGIHEGGSLGAKNRKEFPAEGIIQTIIHCELLMVPRCQVGMKGTINCDIKTALLFTYK